MKKAALRSQMKSIRRSLSSIRRRNGKTDLFAVLSKKLQAFPSVLSFYSTADEICLHPLNLWLSSSNRLFLPKIVGDNLAIYRVDDISQNVEPSHFSLMEPNPLVCQQIPLKSIDCVLVPALAFDSKGNRLGYGKGFYDKLLSKITTHRIGVGFKEQLVESIPTKEHDQKMDEVLLF